MKQGLAYFTDTYLTTAGLLIFFLFFLAVVWWTSRKSNRQLYAQIETLPLHDGDLHE